MNINGKEYTVIFKRQVTPVSFVRKGRQQMKNRMSTTCVLIDCEDRVLDTATVTQFHKDKYDRKTANEEAFKKLAFKHNESDRNKMLSSFFSKR